MNLTNKKIILIYALSPFFVGVFLSVFSTFFLKHNPLSSLVISIHIPLGYLIDYLQMISIVSGAFYVYSAISFLFLVIIPSQLITRLTIREGLISRLIKCVGILIGFSIFFHLCYEHDSFLSKSVMLFIYVAGYVIFFYLVPKKITGIPEKQAHIDWFIHSILSGIIGVVLCSLCILLFSENIISNIYILGTYYAMGGIAVIFFCIPALLVGIVKIKNIRVSPLNQTVTCGVVGFILSCIFGVIGGPFFFLFGIAGGVMSMLVTIMVNLINTPSVKQPEEISQQ